MHFERLAQTALCRWHSDKNRRPLIIRGARQVGKSTLVRNFAQTSGLKLFEINLERYPELNDVFDRLKVEPVLNEISAIAKSDLNALGQSLIFLR